MLIYRSADGSIKIDVRMGEGDRLADPRPDGGAVRKGQIHHQRTLENIFSEG